MLRLAAVVVICAAVAGQCPAQDAPKWDPPKPPEGWKAVVSKDGAYRFFIPNAAGRSGTRERTMNAGGLRARVLVNYYTLKDGTKLEIQAAALSGPAMKGVSAADAMTAFLDGEKEDGYTASEPKDVTVGDIKAKEYRLNKDKLSRRMVMFVAKPRVFELNVEADDPAKLDTETADTFLKSLVLVPADVLKAQAKERAAKDAEKNKENQEKYGVKWTTNLADMTPPDAPALGVIRGKEFKPDSVALQPGGRLVFRQGEKGAFAEGEVSIVLWLKGGESVENKKYEVKAAANSATGTPHVTLSTMPAGARIPKSETFLNRYAMKLTFGAKDENGDIPGTIYLCTPDSNKSFLAGRFTVKAK
jgi:hypothetical protein